MSSCSSGWMMKNLMTNANDVNNYDENNCDGNDGDDDDDRDDMGVNKKLLDTLFESPGARTWTRETRVCALDNSSNSFSLRILPLR